MEKHVFVGLLIPVVFLAGTGFIKTLIRRELLWSNFYLGTDLALAALANGLTNIVDTIHQHDHKAFDANAGDQFFYTVLVLVAALGALGLNIYLHQIWETDENNGNRRVNRGIMLGVVSNGVGGFMLTAFIYLKLRGAI